MLLWVWWLGVGFLGHGKKLLRCMRAHRFGFPTLWFDVRFLRVRKSHTKKSLWATNKFIHVAFACHLLHDSFLVIIAERTAKLVVVHSRAVLLDAPPASHFFGINKFKLHATPCPSDKRGTFRLVQEGHKELPKL